MKKMIDIIPRIAFCGLITFIFLGLSIEMMGWLFKISLWNGVLGNIYSSLNMLQKLISLWFLGIPLYLIYKKMGRT